MNDSFYNEILQGIAHKAQQEGYGLLVGLTGENACSEQDQLRFFQEKSVDGIIISNYCIETIPYLIRLKEKKVPFVICDFETYDPDIPVIVLDEKRAMELLTDYILSLGHQKIGFYYHLNKNSLYRYNIVSDYLHQKGFPKPLLYKNREQLIESMKQADSPTAIMGYSDLFAIEIIHVLKELGISVPYDVSVTGFDDLKYAHWPEYNLTTIYQPKIKIGELSASLLIELIQGKQINMPVYIEPQLIVRKSCME
ncbi:MAG: LacI family transcriptional regulator [Bacteroidales bacterium]|nr:LacI family transcriptional regulator [Bacteroidales bacterium]